MKNLNLKVLKLFVFIVLVSFTLCIQSEENKLKSKISVDTGIVINSITDSDAIVGEYYNFDNSPRLEFGFESVFNTDNLFIYSALNYRETNDNNFVLDMDWKDNLQLKFDTQNFKHRTVHDPLNFHFTGDSSNFEITDLSPSSKPYLDYSETNLNAVYKLKSYENITLHGNIRSMEHSGYGQSYVLYSQSFPQSIYGQVIPVNSTTDDYAGGITFKIGKVVLDNTYSYRRFENNTNKELYVGNENIFHETIPEFSKWQNKFSLFADLGHKTSLYANYITYNVDNNYLKDNMGIDGMSYDAVNVKLSSSIIKNLYFNVFYKTESLDNDVNKWYDSDISSAMNRDVDKWGADFLFRITRNSKIKVKYINKTVDRDKSTSPLSHPVKTEQDTYKVSYSTKLFKKTRVRLEWQRDEITNPFSNIKFYNEASEYGEQYPILTSQFTDNDKFKLFVDTPLSEYFSLNLDFETGSGEYKSENANFQNWQDDYDLYTLTLNYMSSSKVGLFLFVSILQGDSSTYLAPSLNDFEFINENGIWNANIVPFSSNVDTYGIGFNIKPSKKVFVNGNITYVQQDSGAATSSAENMELGNFGMYSKTDSDSLNFNLKCDYKLYQNMSIRFQLIYRDFSNNIVYINDLSGTGYAGIIGFNWKK